MFVFNGTDFEYFKSGVLGKGEAIPFSGNTAIDYYGCANPNVDVNSIGKVAITWSESYQYTQQIQVENGDLDINFTEDLVLERSEIFAAYGYINGLKAPGTSFPKISGQNRLAGDRITSFTGSLNEKCTVPDVAIGDNDAEEGGPTVTYSYFRNGNQLKAQQEGWNTDNITNTLIIQVSGSFSSSPRIASRKGTTYPKDFEIVTSKVVTNPGCDNGSGGTILNYGYRNHVAHNVSEVNSDMKMMANYDPVVTYDANLDVSDFIVTWITDAQCGPSIDNGLNVVSRTMYHNSSNVLPKYDNYSFVNKGNFNTPFGDTRGDQSIPSIAGRYLGSGTVYFFFDKGLDHLLSKYSDLLDGRNNLRSSSGFTSTPNPFSLETFLKINIDSDDIAKEIGIYDITGKKVDSIEPNGKSGSQEVTWKPKAKLINGMYMAKVVTEKETQTIKIIYSK